MQGASALIWSRAPIFHTASMSELPIVPSSASCNMPNLTGLNGSMRPGPHGGRSCWSVHVNCSPCLQKAFLQDWNDRIAVDQPVEPGQMHFLIHGGQQAIAGKPGVARAGREEILITQHVDGIARTRRHEFERPVGRSTIGRDVAKGAIDCHALDANPSARKSNRGVGLRTTGFPTEAQRRVAARTR